MRESRYSEERVSLDRVKAYPLGERRHLVSRGDFADLTTWRKTRRLEDLFPRLLKAADLVSLADRIATARSRRKPILWGLGAHVIKCGLTPLVIDLLEQNLATGIIMNGAGIVHDFEISCIGETSEDVAEELHAGRFGMVEETAHHLNEAVNRFVSHEVGIGEAVGRYIEEGDFQYKQDSILAAAYRFRVPATIHVALGTDILHAHPSVDPARVGLGTHNDFRLFAGMVAKLGGGGCYLNVGSAVILPEVFLKAVSLVRNLGHSLDGLVTANLDMIQHYRPTVNVVGRPVSGVGEGFSITGHHELLIPLLYTLLMDRLL